MFSRPASLLSRTALLGAPLPLSGGVSVRSMSLYQPKTTKFKKSHRLTVAPVCWNKHATVVTPGGFGLKALESGQLTAKQLEAAKRTIKKSTGKRGTLIMRVFTDLPVTAKSQGIRMGKGKGAVSYWSAKVEAGRVVFELRNIDEAAAREAFRKVRPSLPVKTKVCGPPPKFL